MMERIPGVWIFAEQEDGHLHDVGLELLSKGRRLANKLDLPLAAALIGHQVGSLVPTLYSYGADFVFLADDERLQHYLTLPYAKVLTDLVRLHRPRILLFGATSIGRDLAPRVASNTRSGMTADCTDLQISDVTQRGKLYPNLLLQIRPAFGGNIIATIISPESKTQMATVREGVMRMEKLEDGRQGRTVEVEVNLSEEEFAVQLIERYKEKPRVNLKAADIVVSGGYGVGKKENFRLIEELARVLGAEIGASRAAVDAGFIERDHQVGQTGTTVRPKLYIACGISGAIQHRAGMSESKKIIAINKNPNAPIFDIAHYGIVGDVVEVIPRLIEVFKERSK
jgi:electron transfer flavoprotein alpha subunit